MIPQNPLALAALRAWLTTSAGRAYLDTWRRQAGGWADAACSLAEIYETTLPTVLRETRSAALTLPYQPPAALPAGLSTETS